jgi:3-oxoacyl-[acyl-carrier-protein] synthase II
VGVENTWERLVNGKSGIARIATFDPSDFTTQIAGECSDFQELDHFPKVEAKKLDRYAQFALCSAKEALDDSGVLESSFDPERVGVILGTGIGGIHELEAQDRILHSRGPSRISPFFIPKMMANAMSGVISIKYGLQGISFVTGSACASASHAMGTSLRAIQYGEADIVVTGGSESSITPLAIGGFCAMKAMSRRNDDPEAASRPFEKDRDGFVMGEGSTILILEEMERARSRGARIYAEFAGYSSTSDAFHITAPQEDGKGPARAMSLSLKDSAMNPDEVDYINAHGTSTEYNDVVETRALKSTFGNHASNLAVSSTKSMIGHLLGAAGAIGGLVSVLSVSRGVVHPTRNLDQADERCDLDYVPGDAREMRVRAAVGNSLGFGGHNACLVFRSVDHS